MSGVPLFAACGAGNAVTNGITPPTPSPTSVIKDKQQAACSEKISTDADPLVVGWEGRGDLEATMSDSNGGVAVVKYDCHTIQVLHGCHVAGSYHYVGVTSQQQIVSIQNSQELHANLPTVGGMLPATFEASLNGEATLDVALMTIGEKRTIRASATRTDLVGNCDGATHFVRGAMLGAYVADQGKKGEARTAAQVFGISAGAGAGSQSKVHIANGSVQECQSADPVKSTTPPGQCGALVRLELAALDNAAAAATHTLGGGANLSCPGAMKLVGGKCVAAGATTVHTCDPSDESDCNLQCTQHQDGASCTTLGWLYLRGEGDYNRDVDKAAQLFANECNKPNVSADEAPAKQLACVGLAACYEHGWSLNQNFEKALLLYQDACNAGFFQACVGVGRQYERGHGGLKADLPKALAIYQRACDGGYAEGCAFVGRMYEEGLAGLHKSDDEAKSRYQMSCDAGDGTGCAFLGRLLHKQKDDANALKYIEQGCPKDHAISAYACDALGDAYNYAWGFPQRSGVKAAQAYDRACNLGQESEGCTHEAVMYLYGDGVPPNPDKGLNILIDSCKVGDGLACHELASFLLKLQPTLERVQMAAGLLRMSCQQDGYEPSCTDLGELFWRFGDKREALDILKESCRRKGGDSCADLGLIYEEGNGVVQKSHKRAVEEFQKSCRDGSMYGCGRLGGAYLSGEGGERKDPEQALKYLGQGCEDGQDAWSCVKLGKLLTGGDVPQDRDRANKAFRLACVKRDMDGCKDACQLDQSANADACQTYAAFRQFVEAQLAALQRQQQSQQSQQQSRSH